MDPLEFGAVGINFQGFTGRPGGALHGLVGCGILNLPGSCSNSVIDSRHVGTIADANCCAVADGLDKGAGVGRKVAVCKWPTVRPGFNQGLDGRIRRSRGNKFRAGSFKKGATLLVETGGGAEKVGRGRGCYCCATERSMACIVGVGLGVDVPKIMSLAVEGTSFIVKEPFPVLVWFSNPSAKTIGVSK
jgi:hypothetical protein